MIESPVRKICVVTGSRAEYGLLYWIMREINSDRALQLQIVATGMHLANEFGRTVDLIEKDGFSVDWRVDCLVSGDTEVAVTKSIGLGTIGMADALHALRPDCLLILGDRFEMLSAAIAAMIARVPIAHIHGGEATEGLIDEAIRHSLSKMAHIHFTAAEPYAARLRQMGESAQSVHVVGAVGLEWLHRVPLPSRQMLTTSKGLRFGAKNILLVFHPETLSPSHGLELLEILLSELASVDANIFCSASNADPGGRTIWSRLQEFVNAQPDRRQLFTTLGHQNYLGLLQEVDLIVGNSSSGILEAPALGTPTLNMGSRQAGRLRASSVVDWKPGDGDLRSVISNLLDSPPQAIQCPYGDGANAALKITKELRSVNFNGLLLKRFCDQ